jgi:hypothetical protein
MYARGNIRKRKRLKNRKYLFSGSTLFTFLVNTFTKKVNTFTKKVNVFTKKVKYIFKRTFSLYKMSFKCDICGAVLTSKLILKNHQSKAKKCIKIQRDKGIVLSRPVFKCEYCVRDFTVKKTFDNHMKICKEKKKHDSIEPINQQHVREMETLKQTHKMELDSLRQSTEKELESLKQTHKMELDSLRQSTETKCQEQINKIKTDCQEQINKIKTDCQEQINKIKTDCQEQINKIKTDYEKFRDDLYTKTIEEQHKLLAKKEETLVQLANRPTTITNSSAHNNTNNTIIMEDLGLTKKKIGKIMEEHFTEERLLEGVQGVVNLVFPSLLTSDGKLKYIVKDSSRNIFEFSKDGKMKRDEDGQYLATMVYDGGYKKMSEVYTDTVHAIPEEEYEDVTDDNKLSRVVDKFREIKHIKSSPKKFTKCIKKKIMEVNE